MSVTNLPRLTHLSISNAHTDYGCDISEMLQHFHLRHIGITSLDLVCPHSPKNGSEDGEAARKLVNLFPAVSELKLRLTITRVNDPHKNFLALMETMRAFGDWELTCGEMEFKIPSCWRYSWTDLEFAGQLVVAVLRGMAEWRGYFFCRQILITIIDI